MLKGKNKRKMFKKALCLSFALLLSINSLAAVVSDNDGSAFVTKSEFEALKKDFQSQIDKYNTSIDSKTDGAIAAYLAGLQVAKREYVQLDAKTNYSFPLIMQSNVNLWNDVNSTDYYNVPRNRVRYSSFALANFTYRNGAGNASNAVIWNDETDDSLITVPPGDRNGYPMFGFLQDNTVDINPKSAQLYSIINANENRNVGGTNYKIFNLDNYGIGYQYLDYKKSLTVSKQNNQGHFNTSTFWWNYSGVLGFTDTGGTNYSGNGSVTDWTETCCYAGGKGGGNNQTKYDDINSSHIGEWCNLVNIPEQGSGGNGGFEFNSIGIDSSQFVWEKASTKKMIFAGTAMVPAQVKNRFAYSFYIAGGNNSKAQRNCIKTMGFHLGFGYSPTDTSYTTGKFMARAMIYIPPTYAVEYNGYDTTVPSFSALPATCVRYYDSEGKEHYLDEGMFLRNFDSDCEVEFNLTFGTNSGTKNLNFYVSKEPFSRANGKTKLARFKVDNESSEVTSKTLETGKKYHIKVSNIAKRDQLYLLWEPAVAGEYITLDSFDNFIVENQ